MSESPSLPASRPSLPAQKARQPRRLAELIRRRMSELGLTLQMVAEEADLSISTIWTLREGTRGKRPRPTTITKLAAGLRMPAEEVFAVLDHDEGYAEHRLLRVYRELDPLSRWTLEAFAVRLLTARHETDAPEGEPPPIRLDDPEPVLLDLETGHAAQPR